MQYHVYYLKDGREEDLGPIQTAQRTLAVRAAERFAQAITRMTGERVTERGLAVDEPYLIRFSDQSVLRLVRVR